MLTVVTIFLIISVANSGWCGGSKWNVDYSGDKCDLSNGIYKMTCQREPWNCGMRLSSKSRFGKGTASAKMKAIGGEGTNTAFYLYSYGRYNDKSYAWNEIDIEILGKQIYGGKTRIWTNVWTGYYQQHYKLVTVPWDATKGYHTYQIKIDNNNIKWVFDGKTYRTFKYTGYGDLKSTINNKDFQVLMATWGSDNGGWTEMGNMWNNGGSFPKYAYFKNVWMSSSFEEEAAEDSTALSGAEIAAVIISGLLLCCIIIAGVVYCKRRKKRLNGDGASFKDSDAEDTNDDSKAKDESPDTGVATTDGYDMSPIVTNTEPEQAEIEEIEVEVETQA